MMNRLQVELGSYEIFSILKPSDQERLTSLFRPRSFHRSQVIFLKGEPGYGLYLIRSGRVKICAIDRNGAELIFTFLRQGDLLGEVAILDGKPRSATAVAVEDTATLYLDRLEFSEFLKASPQACIDVIEVLCQRLRRVSRQLEESFFLDASGRIARSLLELATSPSPVGAPPGRAPVCPTTQEELATIAGASREMTNKILNSFVDMGLVSLGRKKITILDQYQLSRIGNYDEDN